MDTILPYWTIENPAGTYRIGEIIFIGCKGVGHSYGPEQCSDKRIVYSNEFTIK